MRTQAPRVALAGTDSGCGKTTVTCAILQALTDRGFKAAAFKCGPDYIDPMFHSGIIGAFGGFGYVILYRTLLIFKAYLVYTKNNTTVKFYFEYLSHIPDKLSNYLFCLGTENGRIQMKMMDTSLGAAAVCICILAGFFAMFVMISFLQIRKREV